MTRHLTNRLICFFMLFLCQVFTQCSTSIPIGLDEILEGAKNNREELIEVLDHYSSPKDSLKLKAAIFLIKNMVGKSSYLDPNYQRLQKNVVSYDLLNLVDKKAFKDQRKELYQMLKKVDDRKFSMSTDIEYIKSKLLIEQIDQAFESWDMPWSQSNVSFDKFCRFVLPYKISDEPVERNWRKNVQADFAPLIDSLKKANASIYDVVSAVNQTLIGKFFAETKAAYRVSFSYSYLKQIQAGHCVQATRYIMYVLRALGVPCSLDGVDFFANRSSGHNWTVIHLSDSLIPFDPAYEIKYFKTRFDPNIIDKVVTPPPTSTFVKVYRETFENRLRVNQDQYDRVLNVDMNRIDVTSDYCEVSDINISLDTLKSMNGDVCLMSFYMFDRIKPVSLASTIDGDSYEFRDLGRNTIYLPALYRIGEELEPLSAPFIIDSLGQMISLAVDSSMNYSVSLKRKFPYSNRMRSYAERMRNGRFYASNTLQVDDGVLLYEIPDRPTPYFHEFEVSLTDKYKNVMYIIPDGSFGGIAEIEVFADKSNMPVYGEPLGTDGYDTKHMPENVFDKNKLTFYNTDDPNVHAWVGMSFEKPISINKIRYLPRNDLNTVEVGNEYELFYWNDKWTSLGKQIANSQTLQYEVPSSALFWLRNLSGGKEERPFTVKNGEQLWW